MGFAGALQSEDWHLPLREVDRFFPDRDGFLDPVEVFAADLESFSAVSRLDPYDDRSFSGGDKADFVMNEGHMLRKLFHHRFPDPVQLLQRHSFVEGVFDPADLTAVFRIANRSVKSNIGSVFDRGFKAVFHLRDGFVGDRSGKTQGSHQNCGGEETK